MNLVRESNAGLVSLTENRLMLLFKFSLDRYDLPISNVPFTIDDSVIIKIANLSVNTLVAQVARPFDFGD